MLLFLRETWELFWWAMFCPSRLQQRMNKWLPKEEKDERRPGISFLFFKSLRFISQYLFILVIFNIPFILKLTEHNHLFNWLQLPCIILISYGTGFLFLPLGLIIPLLWLIILLSQPDGWLKGLIEAIKISPPLLQIGIFVAVLGIYLSLIVWLMIKILKKEHLSFAHNVMVIGGTISVMLGVWLATENWLFMLLTSGITGFALFLCRESINNSDVAVVLAVVLAVVSTLPLSWFLVFVGLIAFALAPAKNNRVFITTTLILIAVSIRNLGWLSALIIPVSLVSYYRIFDYFFFASFSFFTSIINRLHPQPLQLLHSLPPYTSELLWLPLPNHEQLFISAFRSNPQEPLNVFRYTQTFSLPGFQITLQNALPQIVADQLKQIQSIPELIFTTNSDHRILPFLISPFYHLDSDSDTSTPEIPLPKVKPELSILLPRLQTIIQDIQSALENENIARRERGLEKINNKLVQLQSQLSSLGLKDEAIKRWTPVLEHWQRVIELEQNEQCKLSQGELINPFQYGNPVRLEQKNLFKGRQRFANEVVRRVLDRDRPTLVLHGPRRCGKTSFLYNFPRLLPSDILPVFVDMQSSAITTSESDFCFGLVRAIHKDCKSQGVQLPNIPKRTDFQASPYTTLEDWLDEALAQIGERRILLNLDEFEKIGIAIQNGQITLRLFDELRHLIQHYEQLCFLFSGVQTLEELGTNWSSYFISVVPIKMLYLEPSEAEELLLNPDPAFALRYAPDIVQEVLRLANCHPYCLQLLGASMVNQANFNHTDFITVELLQASINDAFISGQAYFTNIWTQFTGTTPEEMVIGQELLLQVAKKDILLPITTEIAEKVLTRLFRYHILHKINGGYDFEIPLLKQWVKERAVRS